MRSAQMAAHVSAQPPPSDCWNPRRDRQSPGSAKSLVELPLLGATRPAKPNASN